MHLVGILLPHVHEILCRGWRIDRGGKPYKCGSCCKEICGYAEISLKSWNKIIIVSIIKKGLETLPVKINDIPGYEK